MTTAYSKNIMSQLRDLKPRFPEMNIKRLRVYGSVARGEAGPESDVDLLVDFFETPGLIEFSGMQLDLQDFLGVKVDLTTERALHHALKDIILAEAQDV